MFIIMKPDASHEAVQNAIRLMESRGLTPHLSEGPQSLTLGPSGTLMEEPKPFAQLAGRSM